jgi:glycosyltransferase involved in cell wall biosynthesis
VELIPLGFSSSFVRNQKPPAKDRIRILTVAELIKLKNIDKVISAMKELVSKYNIVYTIIGRGPEKDALVKMTQALHLEKNIQFIDYVPHETIAAEMHNHDIFIMPSYFETFGRVYFEAMAMGIPVICAKNSGIYGIFNENEEGISVDHQSVNEITRALEFLITNETKRLEIGMNGKKLVEQYTWENIATMLHKKYLQVTKPD